MADADLAGITFKSDNIDFVSRDPRDINAYVKISFEDILVEPAGYHSSEYVWINVISFFNFCNSCTYSLSTLLCGLCIAAEWGFQLATVSFCNIWFMRPCYKTLGLQCGVFMTMYGMFVNCCLEPCFEACGIMFNVFKKESPS